MTYTATETSKYLSSPVELYEFNQLDVEVYRYTSNNKAVLSGGFEYEPTTLERSYIEQSQNVTRSTLKVKVSRSLPLVTRFIAQPPSNVINLTIRRYHRLDPDKEVIISWKGRVVNIDLKGDVCQLICDPLVTALKRTSLRRVYQVSCPHLLYRSACGVNEVTFRQNATLTAIDGLIISSTTFGTESNGYWSGGIVRIVKSGMPHVRAILVHAGDDVELDLSIAGLEVGDIVETAPGCDRNITTCANKFNNEENFGGFPFIPTKNPMGAGTPIW